MTVTNTSLHDSHSRQWRGKDDAALLAAAKTDPAAFGAAFDALYRRYATRVYRYCYARTVAAWFFGIAANVCKEYHRYRQRHPRRPSQQPPAAPTGRRPTLRSTPTGKTSSTAPNVFYPCSANSGRKCYGCAFSRA